MFFNSKQIAIVLTDARVSDERSSLHQGLWSLFRLGISSQPYSIAFINNSEFKNSINRSIQSFCMEHTNFKNKTVKDIAENPEMLQLFFRYLENGFKSDTQNNSNFLDYQIDWKKIAVAAKDSFFKVESSPVTGLQTVDPQAAWFDRMCEKIFHESHSLLLNNHKKTEMILEMTFDWLSQFSGNTNWKILKKEEISLLARELNYCRFYVGQSETGFLWFHFDPQINHSFFVEDEVKSVVQFIVGQSRLLYELTQGKKGFVFSQSEQQELKLRLKGMGAFFTEVYNERHLEKEMRLIIGHMIQYASAQLSPAFSALVINAVLDEFKNKGIDYYQIINSLAKIENKEIKNLTISQVEDYSRFNFIQIIYEKTAQKVLEFSKKIEKRDLNALLAHYRKMLEYAVVLFNPGAAWLNSGSNNYYNAIAKFFIAWRFDFKIPHDSQLLIFHLPSLKFDIARFLEKYPRFKDMNILFFAAEIKEMLPKWNAISNYNFNQFEKEKFPLAPQIK